jgi:hypothetical protein
MLDCPECGKVNVTSENVTESLRWGRGGDTFTTTFPVRTCQDCKFQWQDNEASEAITLAQFRFERSKGITRTKFCNDTERRLWEESETPNKGE